MSRKGGGSRHAGWLAGWSAEVLLGWGCRRRVVVYILVFLLPQPVRSRALFETCVSGQILEIQDKALLPVMRLAHLESASPGETLRSNFEGVRPEQEVNLESTGVHVSRIQEPPPPRTALGS